MDIQGFIPPTTTAPEGHSVLSYKEASSSDRLNLPSTSEYKPPCMHTILPTVVEEDYSTNSQANTPPPALPSSSTHAVTLAHVETMPSQEIMEEEEEEEEDEEEEENNRNTLNPALLLNRYDKRKSSPAILGLPFGLKHEAQLSLHLSQQRNSIEAAMLLANFNKLMAFPKANENEHKVVLPQQQHWQDDMSIPSQNKSSWADKLPTEANRRHSYDVNMSWQTMPESFLERPDLLHNIHQSTNSINATNASIAAAHAATAPSTSNVPVFKQESFYHTPTKVSWSHDDLHPSHPLPPHHPHHPHHPTHPYSSNSSTSSSSVEYVSHPISPRGRMYHPNMSSPLVSHTYSRYPQEQHHPLHPGIPVLHPLARQPEMNSHGNSSMKRELDPHQHPYYTYTFPPQHPMQPPPPPPSSSSSSQQQQQRYYYPANGKLPLPSQQSMDPQQQILLAQQIHPPPQLVSKPKRKKQKVAQHEEYEEILEEETNEEDYPEMSTRDIEAARNDPEARPRKQKLRFAGDKYTPQWVRYNGQSKEGLCDTCKPGKWLQLKNSAYWYHKQFFHGISSVSGKEFVQPLETRWVDQDLVEGLCHQCHTWVAVSNVKRKNSVLWYRHAHKCHVYHKPKPNVPKKR